jgi:hypothetical protein
MPEGAPIQAVSAALRRLLEQELARSLPGVSVTTRAPDKARDAGPARQVNVYLFDVHEDPSRRNLTLGAEGQRLALVLRYMLTPHVSEDGGGTDGHVVLSALLSILGRNPRLDIGGAAEESFANLSWARTPVDEMSRLWTAFQAPYRLSVVCEALLFSGENA